MCRRPCSSASGSSCSGCQVYSASVPWCAGGRVPLLQGHLAQDVRYTVPVFPSVQAAVFLCFRVILLRMSGIQCRCSPVCRRPYSSASGSSCSGCQVFSASVPWCAGGRIPLLQGHLAQDVRYTVTVPEEFLRGEEGGGT